MQEIEEMYNQSYSEPLRINTEGEKTPETEFKILLDPGVIAQGSRLCVNVQINFNQLKGVVESN